MSRSKNSVASRIRRKKNLKFSKGYFGARKNVLTVAKNAIEKGFLYSYRDRKVKKRDFRKLWIQRINRAVRYCDSNISYSKFISRVNKEKDKNINRKILSNIISNNLKIFKFFVKKIYLKF